MTEEDFQQLQVNLARNRRAVVDRQPNPDAPSHQASSLSGPAKPKPYQTHTPGKLNKTELYYQTQCLEPLQRTGKILAHDFEAVTLTLVHNQPGGVNGMTYTPDFLVVFPDRLRLVEVKANKKAMREDSWTKLKMACERFPWFEFVLALVNPRLQTITEEILN